MIKKRANRPSLYYSLVDMLDQRHPLYQLADKIDWGCFEEAFTPLYSEGMGTPPRIPTTRKKETLSFSTSGCGKIHKKGHVKHDFRKCSTFTKLQKSCSFVPCQNGQLDLKTGDSIKTLGFCHRPNLS